ncbi:MAG: radical SAM protein [PVC group bacterium]
MKRSSAWLEAGKAGTETMPDPASGPRELHLELTYSCNQKCLMCDIWPRYRNEPELKQRELTFEEIRSLVENSELLKDLELILFSGGEPFLRPDLARLVSFFAEKYPMAQLVILSNCFNRRLIIDALTVIFNTAPGARIMLGTSLDGLGDKHDSVRGVTGAFDRLCETLGDIRERFPGVSVETNFTITPQNADQLFGAFSFTRKMGIGFTSQFPIPWEGTADFSWEPDKLEEVDRDIHRIMQEIHRTEAGRTGPVPPHLLVRLHYLKGMLDYEKIPRRIFPHCPAPYRYAMISPQGDLYFCPKLKEMIVGNVREIPFDRLWLSEKARKIRKHIDSGACHCWLNCTAYINIEEALEKGQPPARRIFALSIQRIYRFYRLGLARISYLIRAVLQILVCGLIFLYLCSKIGAAYLARRRRSTR